MWIRKALSNFLPPVANPPVQAQPVVNPLMTTAAELDKDDLTPAVDTKEMRLKDPEDTNVGENEGFEEKLTKSRMRDVDKNVTTNPDSQGGVRLRPFLDPNALASEFVLNSSPQFEEMANNSNLPTS